MAAIPEKIGIFEVIRQIGTGGMGAVYLGRDPELDRQVAIKVIREEVNDQEVLDRFFREARAAAALRHANIVTVYASGQENHKPYIAMEYIEGESLSDIIKQRRNIPLSEKISLLEQVCAGLGFAHKAGIVHRDVKPANIMIDREGVVRVLDFGIARIEGSAMTQDGTMMGSLNYMSPEQMLGKPVDQRSDIFSVGSVAYELLTYTQAFKGNLNDGLLHRLPHEDPPPLKDLAPEVPLAIEHVVMRALEKDPGRRFQNLADMRTAFVNALASAKPAAPAPRPSPPPKKSEPSWLRARRRIRQSRCLLRRPPPRARRPSKTPPKAPAARELQSEIREPHSQPAAYMPPATSLKLKSENVGPAAAPPPTPVKPVPLPPRGVLPTPANIQIAGGSQPAARRAATVAPAASGSFIVVQEMAVDLRWRGRRGDRRNSRGNPLAQPAAP